MPTKHDFAQPYFGNRIELLGHKIGHRRAMFLISKAFLENDLLEIFSKKVRDLRLDGRARLG
jgi:RNA binding exosome subunit